MISALRERPRAFRAERLIAPGLTLVAFLLAASAFFAIIGQPPLKTLADLWQFAMGDGFSRRETLIKTAPILLCALATAIPGRLGLISVGAEGQLHAGAISGTAVVLVQQDWPASVLLPAMLGAAMLGGALWGGIAGVLRAGLEVNETITTLVLNYVAVLMVSALVYGAWRDPANLGWPATAQFPDAAKLPVWPGTRVHLGLGIGLVGALLAAFLFWRGLLADRVRLLHENRKLGETFGLDYRRYIVALMLAGGAAAGVAGIAETSAVQGRLQPGISIGYGLTGFLVAWLCGHRFLAILPVSLLIGGMIAASDSLQLFAQVPAASATVLQGVLFVTVLTVPGLVARWRDRR
jgi:simple sugar transport system permease protein